MERVDTILSGGIVVTTMDEMTDLAEILVRYPKPPVKGPGIFTASGAFVGLSNDMAEELGFEFPAIEPATPQTPQEPINATTCSADMLKRAAVPGGNTHQTSPPAASISRIAAGRMTRAAPRCAYLPRGR